MRREQTRRHQKENIYCPRQTKPQECPSVGLAWPLPACYQHCQLYWADRQMQENPYWPVCGICCCKLTRLKNMANVDFRSEPDPHLRYRQLPKGWGDFWSQLSKLGTADPSYHQDHKSQITALIYLGCNAPVMTTVTGTGFFNLMKLYFRRDCPGRLKS